MTSPKPAAPPSPPLPSLPLGQLTPEALDTLRTLASRTTDKAVASGLDPRLLELVSLRASQLNGCRYCVDLHTRRLRAAGEGEERLAALPAWRREAAPFDEAERAALALTEAVTLVPEGETADAVHGAARAGFDETRIAHLLWVIALVNAFNRLAIASGAP
ncbi:carboxymuconolactone decarboxylase family protein [Streptomyces sp. 4N509B]|uniref:carboxymuconolactone decarboxylase family protein n=1 Tax=Streptomyces sp. 4N509B TaxID=3457413 RepID=UPI003FD51361